MLRQALLRLTTQALLRRNLLLHPGDPSIEPGKGRDLIKIWGCRVSRWFHPVCTSGVMFIIQSQRIHGAGIYANIGGILMVNVTIYATHGSYGNCYSLYSTFYTVHQISNSHQTSSNLHQMLYVTVFSPLNLRLLMFGPTTGGWAPHKSAPATGKWGEAKPITGPRWTEMDNIEYPGYFQIGMGVIKTIKNVMTYNLNKFWCYQCYPQQLESFCVFAMKKCLCHKH